MGICYSGVCGGVGCIGGYVEAKTGFYEPENNSIAFIAGGEEVMRLDSEGMVYKEERIMDGGIAYKVFMRVMNQMNNKSPDTGIAGMSGKYE